MKKWDAVGVASFGVCLSFIGFVMFLIYVNYDDEHIANFSANFSPPRSVLCLDKGGMIYEGTATGEPATEHGTIRFIEVSSNKVIVITNASCIVK